MSVYDMRAGHLLSGELGPWDTFTPAGYPAFLAALYWAFGSVHTVVGLVQAFLSALTVALTYKLALVISANRAIALIAALAIAAHLPTVLYSGLLLSETWFSFLLVASALLLVRAVAIDRVSYAMLGGLLLGVAATVRPSLVLVLPFLPLFFFHGLARSSLQTLRFSVLTYALLLAPIAAHSVHNSRLVDRWVPTSTNGGLNFYLNFADARSLNFMEGKFKHQITPIPNLLRYDTDEFVDRPFYEDRYFYKRGIGLIVDEPIRLLRVFRSFREALGFGQQNYWPGWGPWRFWLPFESRAFAILVVLPGLVGLVRACKRRAPFDSGGAGWLWIGFLIVGALVTSALFLGDPRIRVPYDPFFAIFAAATYVGFAQHVGLRRDVRRSSPTLT
ncbi:MAG: hypothetical protein WBG86_07645 [Polyangiales bacterium]